MSSDAVIELNNVWKKYSKGIVFHKSLREDILNVFKKSKKDELKKVIQYIKEIER